MRKEALLFAFLILFLAGCAQKNVECSSYSYDKCPAGCVICPPCEVCSSVSCQTEQFCADMGFTKEWYQNVVQKVDETQDQQQIANPASVYCEEQGGTLEIRTAADGSQAGYCTINGIECEEWAFFRKECPVQEKKIPAEIQQNCIGFVIGAPDEIPVIAKIGGAWARPHPGPFAWGFIENSEGEFDFSMADDYVRTAQESNVAILGTIWPYADWDQKTCHDSSCEVSTQDIFYPEEKMGSFVGIPKSRCVPCDYDRYLNFVAKLVERYDGDGIDDMPGLLVPVKYWEVLNEPEMKSDEMTFFQGTSAEYAQILEKSYEQIKESCADCQVLHGGAAGTQQFMLDYWTAVFALSKDFDIANIHYIGETDLSSLNVKEYEKFLSGKGIDKPVWVTEAEFRQESEISIDGALSAGASRVFFTQFKVGQFGLPPDGSYSAGYENIALKCR